MDDQIHIQLSSKPFPLIVGVNTLVLRVVKNGEPISGASIEVRANRTMQGQIPCTVVRLKIRRACHEIPMVWPATDRWTIDVSAWVGDELIRDEFTAFVFAVLEENMSPRETYASNTAIEARKSRILRNSGSSSRRTARSDPGRSWRRCDAHGNTLICQWTKHAGSEK
ncbi:MAG: hypothetical protein IPK17_21625 [Chloroflexi bacterium]|uniref:hypothetical protein n=1 Tax=Candidatus Flexifilum breve TaxID=3140694 RepID=UPI003137620F|nr:hypothetical protein [Chloroflexota bacterium]